MGAVAAALSLQLVLAAARAAGADCNGNSRDDLADIAGGSSEDCNQNRIPDECEASPIQFGLRQQSYATGRNPRFLGAVDLDSDGDIDLVTGNTGSLNAATISVLANLGGGTFAPPADYAAGARLSGLALGDLDGDGDIDAAAAGTDSIAILWGDGRGGFEPPLILPAPAGTRWVAAADVTGDGIADLVGASSSGDAVSVFRALRGGGFSDPAEYPAGDNPSAIAAADFDLDGDLDLAVAARISRSIEILRNQGGGTFAPPESIPLGTGSPSLIEAADLDRDGDPDIVALDSGSAAALLNRGDGTFEAPVTYPGGGNALAAGDFDGDGDPDIAIATRTSNVIVRANDGRGGFDISSEFPSGVIAQAVAPADLDGDGDLDLALTPGNPSSVSFLWNGEEGSLALQSAAVPLTGCADPRGCRPHSGASGDFNGDGLIDVLACITHPGSFAVALNDGAGALVYRRNFVFGGEHPQSLAAGDLDGDGDTDAVTVDNLDHRLYAHLNNGDGLSYSTRTFPVGTAPINVQLADLDGDGSLDAVSANESSSNISVLFNLGNGDFAPRGARDYLVRAAPKAVALADLDGDQDIDIAVANSGAAQVSVLLNGGGGLFAARADYPVSSPPNHVAAADIDGDGRVDLVTASPSGARCAVLLNAGSGTFAPAVDAAVGQSPYSVIAVDFNGDGSLDLITGNEAQSAVSILLGNGDGSFGAAFHAPAGTGLRFVLPGDLDSDGDIDLVTTNREGHSLTVLYNQTASGSVDYFETVCTGADYQRLSAGAGAGGPVQRVLKFLLPARADPGLLPALFQNTRRYRLHQEFLAAVFPDRFPALSFEDYDALVGRRATRRYYAGAIARILTESGIIYGFSVFVSGAGAGEQLRLEEVRDIYNRLGQPFRLRPLAYFPDTRPAVQAAAGWTDPGFPIHLDVPSGDASYQPYTRGVGFGRVRILSEAELEEAAGEGLISFQDILVLDRAPRDIEGVVGGVVTGEPQGELSHVAVRTERRGTPNAFVRGAREAFAAYDGKLVRLEIQEAIYQVREATPEEAAEGWAASRPRLPALPGLDPDFAGFPSLEEMDLSEVPLPPEARFGGKASNLARLQRLLDGPFEGYRERGFAIPVRYYLEFLRENRMESALVPGREVTYEEYLQELFSDPSFQSDSRFRFRTLGALRRHMVENGAMPRSLSPRRLALRIWEVFGTALAMVRCRSSSNIEDILEFNGAGLYDSTSACGADELDDNDAGPSQCDRSSRSERGIAEGLKRVWASLWNFRAFEERSYYGIPQDLAAMGVLVTRAFRGERANGVAFTGNPANPLDRRFVVIAQIGETSVVSPDPGVAAEKTLLEVAGGKVARAIRARGSSLVPAGDHVLSDAQLEELGALLWHIEQRFPVDPAGHRREEILLDIEFKVEADGALAIKQARPFLSSAPVPPAPAFDLIVPPRTDACGVFASGRDPRTEFEVKSVLRFTGGKIQLPTFRDSFSGELFEEVTVGPGRAPAAPKAPGLFRIARFSGGGGITTYRFSFEQEFLAGDDTLLLTLSLLDFQARGADPLAAAVILDERLLAEKLFIEGIFARGGQTLAITYSSCGYPALPLWEVRADLEDGAALRLKERYQPSENARGTGPASLVHAEVSLGGTVRRTSDYWSLVYAAARHNEHVRYWVALDPPVSAPGIERPVRFIELEAPDAIENIAARASYLGDDFGLLAAVGVKTFEKRLIGGRTADRFRRGDASADGVLEASDAAALLEYLFEGGPELPCLAAGDSNDDGQLSITDAILVLLHLFHGLGSLPEPFAACGEDPTPDPLPCESFPACR